MRKNDHSRANDKKFAEAFVEQTKGNALKMTFTVQAYEIHVSTAVDIVIDEGRMNDFLLNEKL